MKKTRQERGITLIALIISIIILLILAIVTIDAVMEDKIIAKAQKASEDYKSEADKEEVVLGNHLGQLDKAEQSTGTGDDVNSTLTKYTKTTQVTDANGDKYWVPAEYSVVKDDTTNGKALVDEGLVIQDDNGNQWVWIPATVSEISEVVDGKNVGKLYNFTSTGATAMSYNKNFYEPGSYADLYNEVGDGKPTEAVQAEFDAMLDSIETYGGYYIGRYENGTKDGKVVIQKGATLTASTNTTNILVNDKVFVSKIWGCQWDNTLRWLVSSGNKTYAELINSKHWGNYDLSYYNFGHEEEWWNETSSENEMTYIPGTDDGYTPQPGQGTKCTTGSSEVWKAGNIYDLAGNGNEYTREYANFGDTEIISTVRGGFWGKYIEDFDLKNVIERNGWVLEADTTRMTLMIK